jgi:hypothetical protein
MESISAGGERAKNGGDADKARSAAAAAAADVAAVVVLAEKIQPVLFGAAVCLPEQFFPLISVLPQNRRTGGC